MQQYAFWFILLQNHSMFRVSTAPIIRSIKTVSATSGTGHTVKYKDEVE